MIQSGRRKNEIRKIIMKEKKVIGALNSIIVIKNDLKRKENNNFTTVFLKP